MSSDCSRQFINQWLIFKCTGINLSVYYSTVIFAQLGLSEFLSQLLAAVMNTGFALGTYPLPWTIERFGRRAILIWSAVVLTVCMVIFVAMIGLPNPTVATQWVAVAAIIVYNLFFGYGWIGVPWLYGPEVCTPLAALPFATSAAMKLARFSSSPADHASPF